MLSLRQMVITKAKTTVSSKVDSAIKIAGNTVMNGSTSTETIQMSGAMYVLYVVFQNTMNNIVML